MSQCRDRSQCSQSLMPSVASKSICTSMLLGTPVSKGACGWVCFCFCSPTEPAPLQRLRSLEQLESLDVEYVDVGTYSMRLHTVRLTELLYLPRLRQLRLVVPGLHDDVDAAAFLGANFMRQLCEGCLQHLDITLLSDSEQGGPCSGGLCSAAAFLHLCSARQDWQKASEGQVIPWAKSQPRSLGPAAYLPGHESVQSSISRRDAWPSQCACEETGCCLRRVPRADVGAVAAMQMVSRAWRGWCRRSARRPGISSPAHTTAQAAGSMPRSPGRSSRAGPSLAQMQCEPGVPRPACSLLLPCLDRTAHTPIRAFNSHASSVRQRWQQYSN